MPFNPLSEEDKKDLDKRFDYHPANDEQRERYTTLRQEIKQVAENVIRSCPPGRERALVITNLEQAMMWAIVAISRNE